MKCYRVLPVSGWWPVESGQYGPFRWTYTWNL